MMASRTCTGASLSPLAQSMAQSSMVSKPPPKELSMSPASYRRRYSSDDSPNSASAARSATISWRMEASPGSAGRHLKARLKVGMATSMRQRTSRCTGVSASSPWLRFSTWGLGVSGRMSRAMAATLSGSTSPMTTAPAATTASWPMRQPSITTALAPMSTLSSTITGVAEAGSTTPASTVPAPMWQFLPTVARPPSTAPMSIMVPSPTTAPMFRMAPIMMTAFFLICTCSRMIAPGSMRAGMSFISSRGMAELRQLFSISTWRNRFPASTGPTSAQSPKTILCPGAAGNTRQLGNSTGASSQTYTFTGVFLGEVRIYSMISCAFMAMPLFSMMLHGITVPPKTQGKIDSGRGLKYNR